MRPLIVYYSKTGNTVPVARAVAEAIDADCVRVEDLKPADMQGRELIGLGTGTYNSRPAKEIMRLIPQIAPGTRVFVFITSGLIAGFLVKLYFSRWRGPLAKQRLNWIGKWHCPGHDKYLLLKWANLQFGRPNEADLRDVREFAKAMLTARESIR
jgi:flavodoxin